MQNIVMATVEFSFDNTDQNFSDLSENQLPIYFKRLITLKIVLVRFTYPEGYTGRFPLYPLFFLDQM